MQKDAGKCRKMQMAATKKAMISKHPASWPGPAAWPSSPSRPVRLTMGYENTVRWHQMSNDFDIMPILANTGGWNRANQTFVSRLQDIIRAPNSAVAA
jgi:hypothetical protein